MNENEGRGLEAVLVANGVWPLAVAERSAAAVREWLTSEAVVEAAASGTAEASGCIYCDATGVEVVRWSPDGEPVEEGVCVVCGRAARAARAAVAGVV